MPPESGHRRSPCSAGGRPLWLRPVPRVRDHLGTCSHAIVLFDVPCPQCGPLSGQTMHRVPLPRVPGGLPPASEGDGAGIVSRGLRVGLVAVLGAGLLACRLEAQGYRLRLDARAQAAAYRGVRADSVLFTDVVVGPTGGFQTTDGFFVHCNGGTHCFFFRPGPYLQGGPLVSSADLTLWGLGLNGLSLRVNALSVTDPGATDVWPGTDPPVQLLEAYADYASPSVTGRLGRQLLVSRLGII